MKEQIIKTVVRSGNGGAVWVPKDWINEKVIVVRPEVPKLSIKEELIKILEPFLENTTAVFLYGSYARDEQEKDSDIDVLVVAKNEFKILHKKFEINVITYENLIKTIKENPIMYYPFVIEAKPIINAGLLEDLKKIKIDYRKFNWFIDTTKSIIKINEEFIKLDKLDGEYIKSYPVIYSLMLRLRGIFLIKCIANKIKYSNKDFKNWLLKLGINKQEFNSVYDVYKLIRNEDKPIKEKIKIFIIEKLLNILKNEVNKYGK